MSSLCLIFNGNCVFSDVHFHTRCSNNVFNDVRVSVGVFSDVRSFWNGRWGKGIYKKTLSILTGTIILTILTILTITVPAYDFWLKQYNSWNIFQLPISSFLSENCSVQCAVVKIIFFNCVNTWCSLMKVKYLYFISIKITISFYEYTRYTICNDN